MVVVLRFTVLSKKNVAIAVSLTLNLNAPFLLFLDTAQVVDSLDLAGNTHLFIIMASATQTVTT